MDPTCGLGDKFRDLVLNLIGEQLLYLIYYHRNIDQLHSQLWELTLERRSIQQRVAEARNNAEQIEKKVDDWLDAVDKLSKQVRKFHEEVSQAKTECSITSCPNPWLRYKLSKRAKAMTEEAAEIYSKRNFDRIAYPVPPPPRLVLTNREGNEGIDSRVPIVNQILEELKNPGVNLIGLCGLAGVGKTTIAKEVAKNQKIFEKVIMATVSQELNIENIQRQIAEKLSMQLNENTREVRAFRLCERLKQEENMLLILDDLWDEFDLGKVGIPLVSVENYSKKSGVENYSEKNEGCKVLLTSRKKALLLDLMKCQKIVDVDVLSEDEALELFKKIAELSTDSSSPELISRATDIVRKCGGLPLAIATAAKTLRNKGLNEFDDALARLNKPFRRSSTLTRAVDRILKLSYDDLRSPEDKHIFLLAAMLSHDLSIEDLIMYSVGLDFFGGMQSMEEAHAGICTTVGKLKLSNLFLDSISSHHVTIHDVFRDVAWLIAYDELHAFIRRWLTEWPDENMLQGCEGICLQESDISHLPEELHDPRLMFFLLNSTRRNLKIPSMFFKSSEKLKVLAITNVHFSSLPLLIFLRRLKALCLHSCFLEDISEIRSLRTLKVLSLAYSEIKRLPVELAELTSLQILNLSHCFHLKEIPKKLLSKLKKLEVLYMINSFHQWKIEGSNEANENASLDELMDLPISSLDIQIPNVSTLPENLFLKMNLKRYRILIGKCWKWGQVNYGTSKILKLELENSMDLMAQIRNLLKGVEDLHLYGSNGQQNVLCNLDIGGFPCLRHLHIESNDYIKYIVMNSAHHEDAFPILESLELKNLKSLENLCEGPNGIVFGQLHTLKMENLPALTGDFSIEDRATKNASNEIFKSLFNNKVLFPKLEMLELSNLNTSIELIWDHQLSHNSFSNLKTLMVKECGFVKLMPVHVLKYLNNLEKLDVIDCYKLENMFDFGYLNYNEEMASSAVIVPLKKLGLKNLPKMKNVCSNNCQRNWHAVTADLCIKDGATNNTSNEISKSLLNKVLFPKLEMLELSNLNRSIALTWDYQLSLKSFGNLKRLMVKQCGFVKLVPFHVLKSLNNLEEVEVYNCNMLEIVFDFEDLKDDKEMESSSVVAPLKKLRLKALPILKNVWSNHHQGNVSFPSLRSVHVENCESLTSIFPASIAKGMLCHVEELQIRHCGIDVIVAEDQVLESAAVTFEFPSLTSLHLSFLRKLRSFFPHQHTLKLPHLHRLSIIGCDELEILEKEVSSSSEIHEEESTLDSKYPLFSHHDEVIQELGELTLWGKEVEMIGSGQFPMYHFLNVKRLSLRANKATTISYISLLKSLTKLEDLELSGHFKKAFGGEDVARFPKLTLKFNSIMTSLSPSLISSPNLTHLNVNWCYKWTTLMTSSIARSLVHLIRLSVHQCYKMEEIITKQEGEDDDNKEIIFRKLEFLELTDLRELRRFCRQNYSFRFPLLDKLVIERCPKFKRFFPGLTDTPSLQGVQLQQDWKNHHEIWDTNLNKTCYQQRYVTSRELVLDDDDAIMISNDQFPADYCPQVEILGIEGFAGEWLTFPYTLLEMFPKLNELQVKNCSFKEIFPTHAPSTTSFHNLTVLKVSNCHQLVYLVASSTVKSLVNLETLEISDCVKMEEIVRNETDKYEEQGITFTGLRILKLTHLPKLKIQEGKKDFNIEDRATRTKSTNISKSLLSHNKVLHPKLETLELSNLLKNLVSLIWDDQLFHNSFSYLKTLIVKSCDFMKLVPLRVLKSLNNLEKLEVSNCQKLEMVLGFEDLNDYHEEMASSSVFVPLNLTHLEVNQCYGMTSLMTSSVAVFLIHITHLSISHCKEIEEIITKKEGEDDEDKEIIFNKMKILKLHNLPRLKRFCHHNYTFSFPLLDELIIKECPEFRRFSPGLVHAPSLRRVKLRQDWKNHYEIWDTSFDKTFYQQRYVTSRELVLDEDDAIKIRNDQFPANRCPQVEILGIEGFVEEWVTFPYTLLERFPKLNELHVNNSSFEEIFPSHGPSSASFHNLIVLKVSKCHQLVYLMTCSTVKSLMNLKTLEVDDCEKMEEIVRNETNEDVESGITFKELRTLKLTRLPKLKKQEDKKDFNIEDKAINIRCTNISGSLLNHNKVLLPKLNTLELSKLIKNLVSLIWDDQLFHNSFSQLKTLIVKSCDFMKLVPLRVLKSLNHLEKLEVSNCKKLEMVLGFEDLNDYHKEMASSSVFVPLNLTHLEVNHCCGLISLMTSSVAAFLVHITHLSISHCKEIEEIITKQEGEDDEDKEIIFNKMKFLELDRLPRLKRFCDYNYTFKFLLLEDLTITECPQLTMFCPRAIYAPQLQSIQVSKYDASKDIWMTNLNNNIQHLFTFKEVISTTSSMALNGKNIRTVMGIFPEVNTLYVESFTDKGVTFPYSSLERFPKLNKLYVEYCSFEEIFPSQDEIIDFMGNIPPFKKLNIANLDKLKSIWKDDSQPIHQNLEVAKVKNCCGLVKLAPSSASFQNLCRLSVAGCHQLIHLLSTSTAESLVSLERLDINDCKKMVEIVVNDTNEDVLGEITFNQLKKIKLTDMPSLKMFSSQSHTFRFPELQKIKIIGCLEMKIFCQGVLETPKLSKVKIEEHDRECKDEGDLNKIIEMLSLEQDSVNI